jgi:hypothetical protein
MRETDEYMVIDRQDCLLSTRDDGVGQISFVIGTDAPYLCCLFLSEKDRGLAEMMGENDKTGKQETASDKFELSV